MKRLSMIRASGALLMTGSLVLGGAACSKLSDKAADKFVEKGIEAAGGGDVDINSDDGSFKMETEDGSMSFGTGEIPENWPDDVPFPDGFEADGSWSTSSDGSDSIMVTGATSKSAKDAIAFYKDKMSNWDIDGETSFTSDGVMLTVNFSNDDRTLNVTATESDGDDGTQMTISYSLIPESDG